MKKTLSYIIILATLLLAVYFLFFYNNKSVEEQERDFAVQDMESLSQIDLKDRNGNEIILSKKDGKWLLNNKYDVRESILNEMLKVVNTMEVVSVVPNAAQDNILKEMISNSIKVSLYKNGSKKPFKEYHVGGATHEQDGTYVFMEINGKAASKAYIAKVPGRRGYFTYRFTPQESEWRSLQYTKLLPQEIKNIKLEYLEPENKEESFNISRDNGNFTLTANGKSYTNEQINQQVASILFGSFSNLSYESFQEDYKDKEEVLKNLGFARLSIGTTTGETKNLILYHMPLKMGDRLITKEGKDNEYNAERLFALNEENNLFASVQIYVFKDILVKRSTLLK